MSKPQTIITEVTIQHGNDQYRANIYGAARWYQLFFTGWEPISGVQVPKAVKDARCRAQAA